MQQYVVMLCIGLFLIVEFVVVGAVVSVAIESTVGKLSSTFPAQPIGIAAKRRDFQSMSSGFVNLGFCIHIAVDDAHLHILPTAFLRAFRVKACSIPWENIELSKVGGSRRWIDLKVSGVEMRLPAWILDDQES